MPDFEEDMQAIRAYTERFGPIPDVRAMSEEDALLVPDKAREALDRGKALTLEEWGIEGSPPPEATI